MSKSTKVERNMSTPESREFWALPDHAQDLDSWPAWKLAGVNVHDDEPAPSPGTSRDRRERKTWCGNEMGSISRWRGYVGRYYGCGGWLGLVCPANAGDLITANGARERGTDMSLYAYQIGKRIRSARQAAGLKTCVLAARLGITDGMLSKWENGHNAPYMSNFLRLCRVLGMAPSELLPTLEELNDVR